MRTTSKKRRRNTGAKWLNTTTWDDHFLRRMVSWVCHELEYPRRMLKGIEFGNRTNTAWSGRAWCYSDCGYVLVRVGNASHFPTTANTHRGGFTIGLIVDRLEALVKVTAHEVAHCEQTRRGVKSRQSYKSHGNTAGSEASTDRLAGYVLTAFREKRDALVEMWSEPPTRTAKAKPSAVEKRANSAFALEQKWEDKLKRAQNALKKARKKADYYRKKYPDRPLAQVATHA